jgi:hypothetical protein
MSEQEKQPEEAKPVKEPTATQLFASYMRTVERVRGLSKKLTKETEAALLLSMELAERFDIHVSGSRPPAPRTPTPLTAPRDSGAGANAEEYKPPVQMHSDAPTPSGKGSAEVEEIRRDAALNVPAEDTAALGAEGIGMMEQLQKGMKGSPVVVPHPGGHEPGNTPVERSNAEGGPVRQGPVSEGE